LGGVPADGLVGVVVVGVRIVWVALVTRIVRRHEVDVPAAGDDRDVRHLPGLVALPVADRQPEEVVVEGERPVEVGHPDRGVVEVDDVDGHGRTGPATA
jgi:hypothetical protein